VQVGELPAISSLALHEETEPSIVPLTEAEELSHLGKMRYTIPEVGTAFVIDNVAVKSA
jgi:hypothetical protein